LIEISVAILFHNEGHLALRSLRSLKRLTDQLVHQGISFEVIATLDRPDFRTKEIVSTSKQISRFLEVDFGSPALSRNHLVLASTGKYIAFLDGDDLWSRNWLSLAHSAAESIGHEVILHPAFCYYFYERDFGVHSYSEFVNPSALSHLTRHPDDLGLTVNRLSMDNIWSAHSFGKRSIYQRIPFRADSEEQGKGIEDWSFNIESVSEGVPHSSVEGTVHMVRIKEQNSQNALNTGLGLLPWIPERTEKP